MATPAVSSRRLTQCVFLAAVLGAGGLTGLRGADPSQFDPSKQNDRLAPTPERTDTRFAPNQEANQRPIEPNERLQDKRFRSPELIERKDAVVGEKRSPIEMKETRDKKIIEHKDAPKPELKTWDKNRHDQERSRYQPEGDQVKKYEMAEKYQSRMKDAKSLAEQRDVKIQKLTTFEKINRFVFKRNGPGTEGGKAMVIPAASGNTPPPSLDTYNKYQVDWAKGQMTPVE